METEQTTLSLVNHDVGLLVLLLTMLSRGCVRKIQDPFSSMIFSPPEKPATWMDIFMAYLNNFIGNIDAKWLRACCKYWYVFGRLDQFVTVSRLVWNIAKHDENNDDDEKHRDQSGHGTWLLKSWMIMARNNGRGWRGLNKNKILSRLQGSDCCCVWRL